MTGFAKSDIGKAREINQDFYYISPPEDKIQLFILADGMGGYNGGEIASKLATEATVEYIKNKFNEIEPNKDEILNIFKNSIEYANTAVYEYSKKDETLQGMGTTLEVCFIYNNKVYLGHVGDSRIYLIRGESARKLTKDHSYVQKLVDDKKITREEAKIHPKKNMLLKALGCTGEVEPDIRARNLEKNDVILMCSDGLTNMVADEAIYEVIKQDAKFAPEKLVEMANNAGGYDNITAIIII